MRLELARATRSYITDYIKFGDAKAGAVLGIAVVIAGAVGALLKDSMESIEGANLVLKGWMIVSSAAALWSSAGIAWHCLAALAPKTKPVASLASFPDIAKYAPEVYVAQCAEVADEAWAAEYERHSVGLSMIAQSKFDHIAKAIWWLRLLLGSGLLAGILTGLIRFPK
jgi:hypothetical protein